MSEETVNSPTSGSNTGNSYICSQVFLLFGMQKPNSKSKLFSSRSRKKCRSIMRNLFTGLSPTVNSTLKCAKRFLFTIAASCQHAQYEHLRVILYFYNTQAIYTLNVYQ